MTQYKATHANATANHGIFAAMPFELGKTCSLPDDELPSVGNRGFHSCELAVRTTLWYPKDDDLLWQVETEGNSQTYSDITSSRTVKFVKRLTPAEKARALTTSVAHKWGVEIWEKGDHVATQYLHVDGTPCEKRSYRSDALESVQACKSPNCLPAPIE